MFCPQALDYGNVADWFAAVGSVAAVVVALSIAFHQHRIASRERLVAANDEIRRMALLRTEVIRIAGEIAAHANSLAASLDANTTAAWYEVSGRIHRLSAQLTGLQAYPISDPVLYAAIGRLAYESQLDPLDGMTTPGGRQWRMKELLDKMNSRRDELMGVGKNR
jgi:hypothetical protein